MPSASRALLLLTLSAAAVACARDPVMIAWEEQLQAVERIYRRGDYELALRGFRDVGRAALTKLDRQDLREREADTLLELGRPAEAIRIYATLAHQGLRVMDRARGQYKLAMLAEELGYERLAVRLYRTIVRVYPELMPGLRSLAHLERIFRGRGEAGIHEHIAWSQRHYPVLRYTELGDNLLYFPGKLAYDRWRASGHEGLRHVAEQLFLQIHRNHHEEGTWDEALWHLSHMYHRQGRYRDEVRAIKWIRITRETGAIFADYEHLYYWVGQLRIARLQMTVLDDPAGAAESYDWFIDTYPINRWRDDALFWQGCAYLRAGREAEAERSFARIPEAYAESKYLRRLDAARAAPDSDVCLPREFEEDEY